MKSKTVIHTIDSHTGGEPTRLIVSGIPLRGLLTDQLGRQFFARCQPRRHARRPARGQRFAHPGDHAVGAGVRLQVAALAAIAGPRGGRKVDHDVATLAAVAVFPVYGVVTDDDPAADTRAQGQQHHAM